LVRVTVSQARYLPVGIAFVATLPAKSSLVSDVQSLIQCSSYTHLYDEQSVFEYVFQVHLLHAQFHGNLGNVTGPFVTSFSIALNIFLWRLQVALRAHKPQASDFP